MKPRDRSIDVARAVAILGVVGGHWLVTGLVLDDGGGWRQASPLSTMPAFTPISWFLQTLGLFFFTGGFAAGLPRDRPPAGDRSGTATSRPRATANRLRWPRAAKKLAVPLALLLGGWSVVLVVAGAAGLPDSTRRTITLLVVSPLWFLLPYLALKASTGVLSRAVDRAGPFVVAAPAVVVVALSDAGLIPSWIAVIAAWSVPWILGVALARRDIALARRDLARRDVALARRDVSLARRDLARPGPANPALARRQDLTAAGLLIGGVAALIVLVQVFGYPASAVGVPGDGRSNLSPPSLFAIALACAQIGVFLLLRNRSLRAPLLCFLSGSANRFPTGSRAFRFPTGSRAFRFPRGSRAFCFPRGSAARFPRGSRAKGSVVGSLNRAALPIYLAHQSVFVMVVAGTAAIWPGPVPGLLTAPIGPQWIIARIAWLPFLALALTALIRVAWWTTRRSPVALNRA